MLTSFRFRFLLRKIGSLLLFAAGLELVVLSFSNPSGLAEYAASPFPQGGEAIHRFLDNFILELTGGGICIVALSLFRNRLRMSIRGK